MKNEGSHKKRNGYPEEGEEPIYATLDNKTTLMKLEEDSYLDEEEELMAHIENCEDRAMEVLNTASVAVTGEFTNFMQRRFTAMQTQQMFIASVACIMFHKDFFVMCKRLFCVANSMRMIICGVQG